MDYLSGVTEAIKKRAFCPAYGTLSSTAKVRDEGVAQANSGSKNLHRAWSTDAAETRVT